MKKAHKDNPLIPAILAVLQQADKPMAIHHLLDKIKQKIRLPELDENAQVALFKLNWLMMNALYQLQSEWLGEGYYLHIATLNIHLQALHQEQAESQSQKLSQQALRDYYLDWRNFSETGLDEIEALLSGVWQPSFSHQDKQQALAVLGLQAGASHALIRQSYRRLISQYHPDKGGNAQQFMQVRQAYEVLKTK